MYPVSDIQAESRWSIFFYLSQDMSTTDNIDVRHYASRRGQLVAGNVDKNHFNLLVDIVGVKNENMVSALREVLVCGKPRKQACEENKVPQSYLSIKIRQLQRMSGLISTAYVYYLCTDKI
ncbi:MAG: PapB/FocB family fimbrial expression transcriptional regulator [Hafnia sp.]